MTGSRRGQHDGHTTQSLASLGHGKVKCVPIAELGRCKSGPVSLRMTVPAQDMLTEFSSAFGEEGDVGEVETSVVEFY
jgi:hypothetical protein